MGSEERIPFGVEERGDVGGSGAEARQEAGVGREVEEWRCGEGARHGGCRWLEEGMGGDHGDDGGVEWSVEWREMHGGGTPPHSQT
jgi:hypothetical protein